MKTLYLKPARAGLIVRDPLSRAALPEAGAEKPDNPHWRRQVRFGDAVETTRPSAKTPSKPAAKES